MSVRLQITSSDQRSESNYKNVLDIACLRFSSMSFLIFLILSMYAASWGDGLNDLSMSIGLTRYSPDNVHMQKLANWESTLCSHNLITNKKSRTIPFRNIPPKLVCPFACK